MNILKRLGDLVGFPATYVPNPRGAVSITAGDMYEQVQSSGSSWYWNEHRLIQAGTARMEQSSIGEWPMLSYVDYLEKGEGGQPTVYVTTRNMEPEDGSYCLHPTDFLVILPPGSDS